MTSLEDIGNASSKDRASPITHENLVSPQAIENAKPVSTRLHLDARKKRKTLPSLEARKRIAENLSAVRSKKCPSTKTLRWKGKVVKARKCRKRVAKVHSRFLTLNAPVLLAKFKQRTQRVIRSRAFWVGSVIGHVALLLILSLLGVHSMIAQRMEEVTTVTELWQIETKFHEPPPLVPESKESLPELLKSDIPQEAEDFSILNRPTETPTDPKTPPAQLADMAEPEADNKPVEGQFQETSAGAAVEVGTLNDQDWSKVRPKTVGSSAPTGSGGQGAGVIGTQGTGAGFGTAKATGTGATGESNGGGSGPSYGASALSLSGGAYPKRAMKEQREGIVHLRVEVLENGTVGQIELHQTSGHKDLDETAIDAARKWRFRPAMKDGKPTSMWVTVPVRYRLKEV